MYLGSGADGIGVTHSGAIVCGRPEELEKTVNHDGGQCSVYRGVVIVFAVRVVATQYKNRYLPYRCTSICFKTVISVLRS